MADAFPNLIAGQSHESASGLTFENWNPADRDDLIGTFPESGPADVDRAVEAARTAGKTWSQTPAPQRGNILRAVGDALTERKSELARIMTREMGKPVFETKGDVQEAIDTAYYAASETRRLFGLTVPSELPDKFNMSIRRPVGVCGIITAWNFPVAVPTWKIFPAIASGNTVVFKPSEEAPHSATVLCQIMADAGVPDGVVNLIHGAGEAGKALVEHPDVDAIGFTGSSETGKAIGATCGRLNKKYSAEMGGKNPMIVMEDADLDLALEGVIWGAYGTTGQRCTATSRLIIHEDVHDSFVDMVASEAGQLTLGPGLHDETDVGPVINEAALEKIEGYMQEGVDAGATVALGGNRATGGSLDAGCFFQPTLLTDVARDMSVFQEEIFGPVLSVHRIASYEEAVDAANDTAYGLSSSIYTNHVARAFRAMQELDAGITYVNGPTIGAEAHMPFGGVKDTGNGHRDGGWEVFGFYTETKTVYVDYSGSLQKAQIDNVKDEG